MWIKYICINRWKVVDQIYIYKQVESESNEKLIFWYIGKKIRETIFVYRNINCLFCDRLEHPKSIFLRF